jgi:hypothetical protein
MKVLMEYTMIFDPSETWAQRSQFEDSLAAFFKSCGLQAEIVQQPGQPDSHRRILIITRTEEVPQPPQEPQTIKKLKAQYTTKRGYDGQYKKDNG